MKTAASGNSIDALDRIIALSNIWKSKIAAETAKAEKPKNSVYKPKRNPSLPKMRKMGRMWGSQYLDLEPYVRMEYF